MNVANTVLMATTLTKSKINTADEENAEEGNGEERIKINNACTTR